MTHLLTSLSAPHLDTLETELVVKATAVCPDLLHWYLPTLRHALEPRPTDSWRQCVAMVTEVSGVYSVAMVTQVNCIFCVTVLKEKYFIPSL